jgi:hypothetical protein
MQPLHVRLERDGAAAWVCRGPDVAFDARQERFNIGGRLCKNGGVGTADRGYRERSKCSQALHTYPDCRFAG